jgi:ribose transport system ATP-binding protein
MTELLLEATGVAKRYGAVAALRDASLSVLPGEVHALMGANGAGKSTLVKILTGTVRADVGSITVGGTARSIKSPVDARHAGIVSVYQDPSLIPDLTITQNLRLMNVPRPTVRAWLDELGIGTLDFDTYPRNLPLPTMRVLDLARALAADPDILMLDEMTAALPADLTERVLEVVGQRRKTGKSVIFISHRLIEVSRLCDRATVLRDGATVGVVDMSEGAAERIVSLMLGPALQADAMTPSGGGSANVPPVTATSTAAGPSQVMDALPRMSVRELRAGTRLHDVSFDLRAGEVLGIVALEGQGQEELFEVLAGSRRASGGQLHVDGREVRFGHPADAIRAGLVYVPADRLQGLLPQRSVHENIALPFSAATRDWGRLKVSKEKRTVAGAIARLQIDTRAQSEVRRLSGGNQQKVTIARWIATGVRTLLCFDPTRGIDVGTKRQIYQLLRELAAAGAAVLLYTSELEEVQLTCDRAVVIFGGRVVAEVAAADADEPTLLRAAYALPSGAVIPVGDMDLIGPAPGADT